MILHLPIFETVIREIEAGRRVALCAVVATRGSVPQVPGAMMLVDQEMNTTGTIGGGSVEAEVRKQASELLGLGESRLLTLESGDGQGLDDAPICGGAMDVVVMPVTEPAGARAV